MPMPRARSVASRRGYRLRRRVADHRRDRLWGVMTVSTKAEPLPPDTEQRLANFTELLATAIANSESRAALGVLADEQARSGGWRPLWRAVCAD